MLGAVLTSARPEFMRHFVGPGMIATMERHEMWTKSVVSVAPMASSHIMTNNLSVSFVTFAGGIAFGLGTFFYLYVNGMMLGVIGAACHQYGMSILLWSFVAPHGALELPSILIAGGAGFRLGYSMLFPGTLRWKDSVAQGGIEATRLVSGIIPLLVIAGILEGFFSPSHAPVGSSSRSAACCLRCCWCGFSGRSKPPRQTAKRPQMSLHSIFRPDIVIAALLILVPMLGAAFFPSPHWQLWRLTSARIAPAEPSAFVCALRAGLP